MVISFLVLEDAFNLVIDILAKKSSISGIGNEPVPVVDFLILSKQNFAFSINSATGISNFYESL